MHTLTAIPAAGPRAPSALASSNRRLIGGLLVSLLLHALLLLLQFGVPGLRPGAGAGMPLSVRLAPPVPVPVLPPAPVVPSFAVTPPAPALPPTPVPVNAPPATMPDLPA